MRHLPALSTILLILVFRLASCQAPEGPPTLTQVLTADIGPEPDDINEYAKALFPSIMYGATTPITVRIAYIYTVVAYDLSAACDPTALSFFGTKDPIPLQFCQRNTFVIILALKSHRAIEKDFPQVAAILAEFLDRNGLNPFDRTTDTSTPAGWANVMASRIVDYISTDGWNSLGDATRRNYRQKFSNAIGYKPVNHPDLDPQDLRKPLRWQPLLNDVDRRGTFSTQRHDFPHLGVTGKPLILTAEEFGDKVVKGPYQDPNKRKEIGKSDRRLVNKLINELFKTSRKLNSERVLLADWWNNKLFSTGSFASYYIKELGLFGLKTNIILVGDMLAQHDAMLVAWKEKLRHDLVRPTTLIRRLRSWKMTRAFINVAKGVGRVDAGEWEPVIPVQAHSEYPSASATLCTASAEFLESFLRDFLGANATIPKYTRTLDFEKELGLTIDVGRKVEVNWTLTEAAKSCGMSRLSAGVHFSPSVSAGEKLGTGLGRRAFEHITDLAAGRIPAGCKRCRAS